jgi:hypothetical protein
VATSADASEVVRLACVMFRSMGVNDPGDPWREAAIRHFAARVSDDAIGAVVDHPTIPGRVVASGAVTISMRLPTPPNPTGGRGIRPRAIRRGHPGSLCGRGGMVSGEVTCARYAHSCWSSSPCSPQPR